MYKALIEELRATDRIPERQMRLIEKRLNRSKAEVARIELAAAAAVPVVVAKKFPIGKVALWMIVLVIAVEVGRPYIEVAWQYVQ